MTSENLSQSSVPSLTAAIAAVKGRVDRIILLKNLLAVDKRAVQACPFACWPRKTKT